MSEEEIFEEQSECFGLGHEDSDYILTEGDIEFLPFLKIKDNVRFEYNQSAQEWSKKSCTIFSPMGQISDLINHEFTLNELKEVDELSYTLGRTRGKGWSVKQGVDCAVKWFNNSKYAKTYGKLAYKYVNKAETEKINAVLAKLHGVCTGYNGNAKFQNDYYYDAKLDGTEFGVTTYGHALSIVNKNGVRCAKDNYKGRKGKGGIDTNYYELTHDICEIPCWHLGGYVIYLVKEENLEELKRLEEFKTKVLLTIENNSAMWHLTNSEEFKNELHKSNEYLRAKLKDIEEQIRLHS